MQINQINQEKVLSSKARKDLPASDFVFPAEKRYPIHDLAHARNALARVSAYGTPEEKKKVRAAVYRRYPELKKANQQDLAIQLMESREV